MTVHAHGMPQPGAFQQRQAFGIRLGLRHVTGMSDTEIASIEAARTERPFRSLEDFARRTCVSRPVLEGLVHVGAFDSLAPDGRRALLWRIHELWELRTGDTRGDPARRVGRNRSRRGTPTRRRRAAEQVARSAGAAGSALPLPLETTAEVVPFAGLRPYSDAEKVRAELEVLGLDVSRHLLDFYGPECRRLGAVPSGTLRTRDDGERLVVAGVKVATQTPAVRSGQRIIFLTLDDPTGLVDVTVFPSVQRECAGTVFHGLVLAIRGKLRRTGPDGRGISLIAERVWDVQRLAFERGAVPAGEAGDSTVSEAEVPLGHKDDRRRIWHASGGSAG